MDYLTIGMAVWAVIATVLAWLYHRLSVSELKGILARIQQARDELSDGGKDITPEEALVILDSLLDALLEE